MEDMSLTLLVNLHLIYRFLQLAYTDLILVLELHVLFLQLGDVGKI